MQLINFIFQKKDIVIAKKDLDITNIIIEKLDKEVPSLKLN